MTYVLCGFIFGYLTLIIMIHWQHNKKKARRIILLATLTNNQASNIKSCFHHR